MTIIKCYIMYFKSHKHLITLFRVVVDKFKLNINIVLN